MMTTIFNRPEIHTVCKTEFARLKTENGMLIEVFLQMNG